MPLDPTFPPKFPRIFHKSKKWIFSGRVFNADSEYMLDVTYRPILAEKNPKNPFFGNIPQKGKTRPQKKNFFFFS
jgi:hypothetical protein